MTILILERSPVISLDLFEIVADAAPDAAVHVVRRLADAMQMLEAYGMIDIAFIGSTKTEPDAIPMLRRLSGHVQRLVLTDDVARAEAAGMMARVTDAVDGGVVRFAPVAPGGVAAGGWFAVPRPFAPRAILDQIRAADAEVAAVAGAVVAGAAVPACGPCADLPEAP